LHVYVQLSQRYYVDDLGDLEASNMHISQPRVRTFLIESIQLGGPMY